MACASDASCVALSAPLSLAVTEGPPDVGNSLRLVKAGASIRAHWTDVAGFKPPAVMAASDRGRPFDAEAGSAESGVAGSELLSLPEPIVFLRVAKSRVRAGAVVARQSTAR